MICALGIQVARIPTHEHWGNWKFYIICMGPSLSSSSSRYCELFNL
jgi:hypothetical protein